jgi:spermidine synthase
MPLLNGGQVLRYRDGKTATVSLVRDSEGGVSLATNGKTDARLMMASGPVSADEPTMVLLGTLPLAANPHARTGAVIGMGSGLSAHNLLGTHQLERLDTIEIEPEMVEGARGFGERVHRVFDDPRSHVHFEDAKVFFSTNNRTYDLIMSEPSNPWVSGVSSLFTQEFYHHVKRHLSEDGVFAQWLQLYEMDMDAVASIMTAVSSEFSDYAVISLTEFDVLILARKQGAIGPLDYAFLSEPGLATDLKRIGVRNPEDIQMRWLGTKSVLDGMFQSLGVPENSDYFPYVDHNAVRARFMHTGAGELTSLATVEVPLLEMIGVAPTPGRELTQSTALSRPRVEAAARSLRAAILERRYGDTAGSATPAMLLPILFVEACDTAQDEQLWVDGLVNLASLLTPASTPAQLEPIWARITDAKCFYKRSAKQREWLDLVRAVGRRDASAMAKSAEKLLSDAGKFKPSERMQYALRAAMLGNLLGAERGNVSQLWFAYGTAAFGSPRPVLDARLMMTLDDTASYQQWHGRSVSAGPVLAGR